MNQEPQTNLQLIQKALNLISAKFEQHSNAILNLQVKVKDLSSKVYALDKINIQEELINLQKQINELKK